MIRGLFLGLIYLLVRWLAAIHVSKAISLHRTQWIRPIRNEDGRFYESADIGEQYSRVIKASRRDNGNMVKSKHEIA